MSSLPSAIFFINGDISYPPQPPPNPPDLDVFIGSQPNLPQSDASVSELTNLQIQLFINDTMTKAEFDARVAGDPNYPTIVHLQNLRILVILPTFRDYFNRKFADVVMFLSHGLASVERNRLAWPIDGYPAPLVQIFPKQFKSLFDGYHKFESGPPGQTYDTQRLTIYELLRAARHAGDIFLPFGFGFNSCDRCHTNFYCDREHTFSGIRKCRSCGNDCKCGCDVGLYTNQGIKISPIHLPNCDNEKNNPAFIFRK
jgi:hypothetical protein